VCFTSRVWNRFYSYGCNMSYLHRNCFTSWLYGKNSIMLLKRALVFCEISPSIMPINLLKHVLGTFAGDAVVSQH
jgi:hypothetical protein